MATLENTLKKLKNNKHKITYRVTSFFDLLIKCLESQKQYDPEQTFITVEDVTTWEDASITIEEATQYMEMFSINNIEFSSSERHIGGIKFTLLNTKFLIKTVNNHGERMQLNA